MTAGQEAVLTNMREARWGADECRWAAFVAAQNLGQQPDETDEQFEQRTRGPLYMPGKTDEERAAAVAFWEECADMAERGEADWL